MSLTQLIMRVVQQTMYIWLLLWGTPAPSASEITMKVFAYQVGEPGSNSSSRAVQAFYAQTQ